MAKDREFTDPFTGDILENPERKSYRVTYSVREFSKQETVIDTLAEGRLTKAQAKQKIAQRPTMAMTSENDITIHSIKKVDDNGGTMGINVPGL